MINIIASTDLYSLWGAYILNNLTQEDFEIKFTKGLNVEDVRSAVGEETSYGVVLLGKPLQESQTGVLEGILKDVVDTPFTKAYHFANWGETLSIDVSIVDTDINFVSRMVEHIITGDELIRFKDEESAEFAKEIAEGLQSHHVYDGGLVGKNLMLLAELYGEKLLEIEYTSIKDMGDKEELVLRSLQHNMDTYVNTKIGQANIQELSPNLVVVFLIAERHVNEIGRAFINSLGVNGRKVIVMIGQQTRGDDLYRIRTSEGVSAERVAHYLNRGKGKERAATVFLPKGNQAVYNTIISTLNGADICT